MNIGKKKFFDIATWICAISYILAFFSVYFKINGEYQTYEKIYAEMMSQASYENAIKNYIDSGSDSLNKEEPLFIDGKTAIDYAYNNYRDAVFSEVHVIGTVVASAVGQTMSINVHQIQIRYESGAVLVDNRIYLKNDKFGVNDATRKYYSTDGYIYQQKAEKSSLVLNSDNTISCSYTAEYKQKEKVGFCTYIVTKDTMTKELFFKVNYNSYTGKIDSYSASTKLNTISAVEGYDLQTQRDGNLEILPKFLDLELHCVIDKYGVIKSAVVKQSYSSKRTVPVLGSVSYTSNDIFNIEFTKLNEGTPSIAEPVI